ARGRRRPRRREAPHASAARESHPPVGTYECRETAGARRSVEHSGSAAALFSLRALRLLRSPGCFVVSLAPLRLLWEHVPAQACANCTGKARVARPSFGPAREKRLFAADELL